MIVYVDKEFLLHTQGSLTALMHQLLVTLLQARNLELRAICLVLLEYSMIMTLWKHISLGNTNRGHRLNRLMAKGFFFYMLRVTKKFPGLARTQ